MHRQKKFRHCSAALLLCTAFCLCGPAQAAPPRFIVDMAIAPGLLDGRPDQLFCLDHFAGLLYRVDPATGACALVAGGLSRPHGIAIDQSDNLSQAFIAELRSGRIVRIDLATGGQSTFAQGLHLPARLALGKSGGQLQALLYVTELFRGTVSAVASDGAVQQAAAGIPLADGIALEPGGATALVGTFFAPGAITRIDLATGEKIGHIPAGLLLLPAVFAGPVATPAGSTFFVSELFGNRVKQLDCDTGGSCRPAKTFRNLRLPIGVALSQDRTRLYVAESFSGRILSIDLATGQRQTIALLPRPE